MEAGGGASPQRAHRNDCRAVPTPLLSREPEPLGSPVQPLLPQLLDQTFSGGELTPYTVTHILDPDRDARLKLFPCKMHLPSLPLGTVPGSALGSHLHSCKTSEQPLCSAAGTSNPKAECREEYAPPRELTGPGRALPPPRLGRGNSPKSPESSLGGQRRMTHEDTDVTVVQDQDIVVCMQCWDQILKDPPVVSFS